MDTFKDHLVSLIEPFGEGHNINNEIRYVDTLSIRSEHNMANRLKNIYNQIDKMSPSTTKKYQVRGYREAKIILRYCQDKKINAVIEEDCVLKTNKITRIIGGYDSKCCNGCDGKPTFINKLVPVIYVKIESL
jgi:hypothetical protein